MAARSRVSTALAHGLTASYTHGTGTRRRARLRMSTGGATPSEQAAGRGPLSRLRRDKPSITRGPGENAAGTKRSDQPLGSGDRAAEWLGRREASPHNSAKVACHRERCTRATAVPSGCATADRRSCDHLAVSQNHVPLARMARPEQRSARGETPGAFLSGSGDRLRWQ